MAFAQDCLCLVCAPELCGAVGDLLALAVFAGDDAFGAEDLFQCIKGDKGFSRRILLGGLLGVDAVPLPVHSPEIVLRVCDGHRLRGLFVLYFGTFFGSSVDDHEGFGNVDRGGISCVGRSDASHTKSRVLFLIVYCALSIKVSVCNDLDKL